MKCLEKAPDDEVGSGGLSLGQLTLDKIAAFFMHNFSFLFFLKPFVKLETFHHDN
jgi:hypothetical protein